MLSDRRHPDETALPCLSTLGMVEAIVICNGETIPARRYYLSSAAVRAHWRIENCLHWAFDAASMRIEPATAATWAGEPRDPV
jgi:hypothetical protein